MKQIAVAFQLLRKALRRRLKARLRPRTSGAAALALCQQKLDKNTQTWSSDQPISQDTLLRFVTGEAGLAEGIMSYFTSVSDWPFHSSECVAHIDERTVLNLWGFKLAIMKAISGVSNDEKTVFIHRFHNLVCSMWTNKQRLTKPIQIDRILRLSAARQYEYDAAFAEAEVRYKTGQALPMMPLARAVTKNLFSREHYDPIMTFESVSSDVEAIVLIYLTSFAQVFGKDWKQLKSIVENGD